MDTRAASIERLITAGYPEAIVARIPPALPPHARYPLCLLVIPSVLVPLDAQLAHAGITLMVHEAKLNVPDHRREPYWIRIQDGSKLCGCRPSDDILEEGERGLTVTEGIALALHHPEVLADHSIDLLASSYGSECTPTIYAWEGRVMLSAICSDVSDPMCGAPTTFDPL